MFHVVLHQPEIPPNTGNVMRLCANSGVLLHLIEPLGFDLSDKHLARAGMDYRDMVNVSIHPDWTDCCTKLAGHRFFVLTTHASRPYGEIEYLPGDVFVFGAESCGLPVEIRNAFAPGCQLRIPMREGCRSLNLSNSVAIVVYEAWRQQGFVLGE